MTAPRIILSEELIKKWGGALRLPDNVRRMVLDLQSGEPVRIYYECFGDARILEIETPAGALAINVAEEDQEG